MMDNNVTITQQKMQQTFTRSVRAYSLPKLQKLQQTESKLFQTSQQLHQTRKIFLDRVNSKQPSKNNDDQNQKSPSIRSFIQFPKKQVQEGFTAFKVINKNQSEEIIEEIRNMRSKSTLLKPFIKAEIMFNKAAHDKIRIANQLRVKEERDFVAKRIKELTPNAMNKEVKIKEKFKGKVKNVRKITLQMNFKVYERNLQCWKPYIDYDSLAVAIKQQVFFIGGRKKCPPVVYNIMEDSWKQLQQIPGMKCFGQTDPSIIDKKKIICFGGYNYFQQGFSLITNTIRIIDLKTNKIQITEFPETKTACRAFHSQCVYGKYLIVSGGIDKGNKLFGNFMNYHYEKNYWNQLTIQKMPQKLKNGFAKCQTIALFHTRNTYSIYDNEPIIQLDPNLKQQGIYIYGGQDSNADMIGQLYVLHLGQPALTIDQLPTSGPSPLPRRNPRLLRHKEYLIIHGGKNDELKPPILNTIHFLHLRTLTWIKVGGEKAPYRYSHALTVVGDQIVIMGGKGLDGLSKEVFLMGYEETVQYV